METTDWLKIDANEGSCVLDASQLARVLSPEIARRYPRSEILEKELSTYFQVPASQIIATAGADDAIDRAFRALAGPGASITSTIPGFVEFLDASKRTGAEFFPLPRIPGENFPLEEFKQLIEIHKPSIAVIASPDNPLGTMLSMEEFRAITDCCIRNGTIFILDVTYIDFADTHDLMAAGLATANVLITGSFSKSRGLAGFRSGWAMAGSSSTALISRLREAGPPFSLSSPAIEASRIALIECEERYRKFVDRIAYEREALGKILSDLGMRTWPQQANFVTIKAPDAANFVEGLRARGILVRYWPNSPAAEGLVRITCPGDDLAFDYLKKSLESMEATP